MKQAEVFILGRGMGSFIYATLVMMVLTALLFGLLKWLNIPSGSMVDWIIAIATAWWLLAITTAPWNVYFEALAVQDDANNSIKLGISVDEVKAKYVGKIKAISLTVAIGLHLVSAAVLFYLSAAHITPVGYYGAAAAALLTILRPSIRAYEYLWQRLRDIRHTIKYPREDVLVLRGRIDKLEQLLEQLSTAVDPRNPESVPASINRTMSSLKIDVEHLAQNYTKLSQDNRAEHETLRREGQSAIAKLSSDSQFLDHVREIVRMIKSA